MCAHINVCAYEYFHLDNLHSCRKTSRKILFAIFRTFADTGVFAGIFNKACNTFRRFAQSCILRAYAFAGKMHFIPYILFSSGILARNWSVQLISVRIRRTTLRYVMQRRNVLIASEMRFEVSRVNIELQSIGPRHSSSSSSSRRPARYGNDLTPVDPTARPDHRRDITRASALFPCSLKYAACARTAVPTKAGFMRSILGDYPVWIIKTPEISTWTFRGKLIARRERAL